MVILLIAKNPSACGITNAFTSMHFIAPDVHQSGIISKRNHPKASKWCMIELIYSIDRWVNTYSLYSQY